MVVLGDDMQNYNTATFG